MVGCSVFGCSERSDRCRKTGVTFHKFPSDSNTYKLWIYALRRDKWTPTAHSRVCSNHFEESCFNRIFLNVKLWPKAVPTIFKSYPKHLQKEAKKNRIEGRKKRKKDITSKKKLTKTAAVKKEIIDEVTMTENGEPVCTDVSEGAMMTVSPSFYPEPNSSTSTSFFKKEILPVISSVSSLNTDMHSVSSEKEIIQRRLCAEVFSDLNIARLMPENIVDVTENEDPAQTVIPEETMNVDPSFDPEPNTASNSSEKETLSKQILSETITNTSSPTSEREIIQFPSSEMIEKRLSDPIMVSKEIVLQPENTSTALDPNFISALNAYRQAKKSIVPPEQANRTKLSFFVIQPQTNDAANVSLPGVNVGSTSTRRIPEIETLSALDIGLSQDLNSMFSIFKDYNKKLEKSKKKIKLLQQTIRRQNYKIQTLQKIANELSTYKFSHKMEDIDGSEEIYEAPPTTIIKLTRDG